MQTNKRRTPRFGFNTLGNVIPVPCKAVRNNITLIAAMDRLGGIGLNGKMPWHLREDMLQFRRLTTGHPVVMGRKTFESLGCKPLPGRLNIVLTKSDEYIAKFSADPQVIFVTSMKMALDLVADYTSQVFVIGGAEIYKQAMSFADDMILTRIDKIAVTDTKFPEINPDEWHPPSFSTHRKEDTTFTYSYYLRR